MNERIRKLRKTLDLTQQEFGAQIGMKQNTIALIEAGRNTSEQTILAICRVFGVNEEWLRTGNGEMFEREEKKELAALVKKYHLSDAARKVIENYVQLDENTRAAVDSYIERLFTAFNPAPASPAPSAAPEQEKVTVFRAARSVGDQTEPGFIEVEKSALERLENAPRVTSDDDI